MYKILDSMFFEIFIDILVAFIAVSTVTKIIKNRNKPKKIDVLTKSVMQVFNSQTNKLSSHEVALYSIVNTNIKQGEKIEQLEKELNYLKLHYSTNKYKHYVNRNPINN